MTKSRKDRQKSSQILTRTVDMSRILFSIYLSVLIPITGLVIIFVAPDVLCLGSEGWLQCGMLGASIILWWLAELLVPTCKEFKLLFSILAERKKKRITIPRAIIR